MLKFSSSSSEGFTGVLDVLIMVKIIFKSDLNELGESQSNITENVSVFVQRKPTQGLNALANKCKLVKMSRRKIYYRRTKTRQ